jgi:hypothetical protein
MNDKFLFGIVLGMLGGAVIVSNSSKARKLIKDGQQQLKEKVDSLGNCSSNCCEQQ